MGVKSDDVLYPLAELFATRPAQAWESLLAPAGIPCVVADEQTSWEFFHTNARADSDLMVHVQQVDLGEYFRHASMLDFSRSEPTLGPPTRGGEHTRTLTEELGYSAEEVDAFFDDRVLWSAPPPAASEA